jgi:hypothetical protein
MPKVNYHIENLSTDNRASEIPIKIVIKNESDQRIKVLSIVPNIPEFVVLEEKKDSFQEDTKKRYEDLCQELTFSINHIFLIRNQNYRQHVVETARGIYKEIIKDLPKLYRLLFFDRLVYWAYFKNIQLKANKMEFKINNYEDAIWAYDRWVKNLTDVDEEKSLYEGKMQQLATLKAEIGNKSGYISIIESGSFYSRTYVLGFSRKYFNAKAYNLSFDSKYSIETASTASLEYRDNTSTTITIPPKPFFLTIFTALASVLGTTLKYCMNDVHNISTVGKFFYQLGQAIVTGPGITSIIVGVLFFNIYEFTDLGKKINMGVNWRSALLIGILAGLFGDRLIEALKVFIGFK